MMDLLHLSEPGPLPPLAEDTNRPPNTRPAGRGNNYTDDHGNTYVRSGWGHWSNYDENKANPYRIPDPLILRSGHAVKDAETWRTKRRPEILNDFLTEVYGRIPGNTPRVTWEVASTDTNAVDGTAIQKRVVGHIDNSSYPAASPSIDITLYLPAKASGRLPLMVVVGGGFAGFRGRGGPGPVFPHTPAATNASSISAQANGSGRGDRGLPGGDVGIQAARAQVLALGWGYATVNTRGIQADTGSGLSQGIIGLTAAGKPRQPGDWGVLAAWAWGLSRAMDYFETDKSVDATRVGIEGHSRWGKEALLAAALDPRWAIVYSSCSGECGAKLSRRNWGETVDNVAGEGEYHWMAGNFLKYAGHWNDLPVDAHELVALVAPRPVFITGGTQDQWSDPHGEFLACVGAGPVYRLLGRKDLGATELPAPDIELISGDIGFRMHEGGHTDLPDWPAFLRFARKYFDK